MDNDNRKSLCLMLACSVYGPIDIKSYIEEEDLYEQGIERESHITCFYGPPEKDVDKKEVLGDIKEVLGDSDFRIFTDFLKADNYKFKLGEVFYLDCFENPGSDYLVLRLKDDNQVYKNMKVLNKGLTSKFGIILSFSEYKPHLTLAQLQPGMAKKYIDKDILKPWIDSSTVRFEDFTWSEGFDEDTGKWNSYNITTYHAVERYFYMKHEKEIYEED